MKKTILMAGLAIVTLQRGLYAQTDNESAYSRKMNRSKTEQTFNADQGMINIRDFVDLKEGRLILEVHYVKDYESFRNLDSILENLRKDIAFYKDSLDANPTGNLRIDYVANTEYSFKKIRIKKYNADGNIFLNRDGEISRLKFEQDTVRIIVQKWRQGLGRKSSGPCTIPYSIQATFILGNYYDIDKVLADKVLNNAIDTLEKVASTKKMMKPFSTEQQSVVYNPYYSGPGRMQVYNRLIKNEYDVYGVSRKSMYVSVKASLGAGLVRNTASPMGELGLQYNRYWNGRSLDDFVRLSVSPYYFFDKNPEGGYVVNDNWFVNAAVGSIYDRNQPNWFGKECSFGIGYLAVQKGSYFKNTTFKIFTGIKLINGLTIVPEVILTDNFRQVFPGVTLKVF